MTRNAEHILWTADYLGSDFTIRDVELAQTQCRASNDAFLWRVTTRIRDSPSHDPRLGVRLPSHARLYVEAKSDTAELEPVEQDALMEASEAQCHMQTLSRIPFRVP
jgi:hypothetical protein